jgi:AhpD family alkylhydroperoxidase
MNTPLLARPLRGSARQVRHVTLVRPSAAPEPVARVYRQVETDFGMLAPPVALHSPAPDVLAAVWSMLRETMVADGAAGRDVKEAVASAVSAQNACPYCVAVHGATLAGLVGGTGGRDDPALRVTESWARARGRRATVAAPPGPAAAELVGVVATFQYLNRMVTVFLGDSPLPPAVPAALRGPMTRLIGRYLRGPATRPHPPGRSLGLLPAAPPGPSWAAGAPHVAGAFAGAAAVLHAAGARTVPAAVRELLGAELAAWDGEPRGPSRAWASRAAADLSPADRPAGLLALLTAFAPYQVDDGVIEAFRADRPGDDALLDLTAWASFAAASTVAAWPVPGSPATPRTDTTAEPTTGRTR